MAALDLTVWSATLASAWVAKPSSRARSARSLVISMISGPLSCSPEFARLMDASNSRRRTSRLRSTASSGCPVGRIRVIAYLPSCPRAVAASAAVAIASALRPSSSAAESSSTTASSVACSRFC